MNNNQQPLVSITIPTYNSADFLVTCLDALKEQTYKNTELYILDGGSSDETRLIAERYGATFVDVGRGLLRARLEGVRRAQGDIVMLLDSDQVLFPDTVARAVDLLGQDNDMLVLEEDVYRQETLLETLFHYDRVVVNYAADLNPLSGVMLPRVFRTDVLRRAMQNIPKSVLNAGDRDHAIIYYEMSRISDNIAILKDAVTHIEPQHIWPLMKKFYRWGQTNVPAHHDRYQELMKKKEVFRKGLFAKGIVIESLGSILLLILKGVPYKAGYYIVKLKK